MDVRAVERAARVVMLGAALVFLVLLLLDWHRTFVEGVEDAVAASSGWSGWGLLAGFFALALIGFELDDRLRRRAPRRERALVDQVLATGLALATVAAVFTGDASVSAGSIGVEVDRTLWPAWAALAVAAVTVFAAFVAALTDGEAPEPRATAGSASRNPG